ncbi:hypothetical protein AVEN_71508-1 [Araneus ventricosus]|uniref:Uncharacterized protein n=1 Tax=Araneus ventricosus TaxID=182803 RepID=A0A4Y2FEE3_ARAVE|nr:hypothetical protein AVEN_71508-1 [Araneus ventricosus]
MCMKKDSEDKKGENSEGKCEAMDASETLINGATIDEPNVTVENFSLSNELHGPESLPKYGESSHSTPTKCESNKKAKYEMKYQHKHRKKKKKHS